MKYNLWSSIIPKANETTLEDIVTWATYAECKWWIKSVEKDDLTCYQLIFNTPIPVTRRFVVEDLGWNTHFYPLDFEVSSYDALFNLLNGPSSYYIWTNDEEPETNTFSNTINAPPNGFIHLVYSQNSSITNHIQTLLQMNKVYVIRLQPNNDPLPIVKRVQHLASTTIIIIIHNSSHLVNESPGPCQDCLFWKVNKYNNKIIESPS